MIVRIANAEDKQQILTLFDEFSISYIKLDTDMVNKKHDTWVIVSIYG